jgi:DNA-binding NarL/FixJ family response regulator
MPEMSPKPEPHLGTILVVDDAPDTLRMLCDALAREGYTVLVARDGEQALSRLELVVPDAILLDAVMPGLSGFQTCERIKAHAGGVDYVVKPVRIEEVMVRLATHVRNARVTRLAREAVDVGGHGVLVLDARQRIAWRSPQAERWLQATWPDLKGDAPLAWLQQLAASPVGHEVMARPPGTPLADAQALVARSLGAAGLGETMVLLSMAAIKLGDPMTGRAEGQASDRVQIAALTPRETEVLSWLAKGKTNRDIADILGMSHRTVNKHLEHIFEKLGVETRAAAAALASRTIPG